MQQSAAGHFHAVKFYDSPTSLCRIVGEFLSEGFAAEQPALIVATPEHHAGIARELATQHLSLESLEAEGKLVLADASEMLATFMVDGIPDASLFAGAMAALIDRVRNGRRDVTVRIYGEMVDVLWKNGQETAAILTEMLWNKLALTESFSLLCGYNMGPFYKDTQRAEIELHHSHVLLNHGSAAQAKRPLIH
jgi:MEDS: MEthanogen/methylotroph, DcmR Sensory domain